MNELTAAAWEIVKANLFVRYNHIELLSVEPDAAFLRLQVRSESKNPYGVIHGGALFTMADNGAGIAANTDGRHYVTHTSSFTLVSNQMGGTVYAEARVRHRGKTTCLVAVDITGEDGKLLATGEFVYYHVDKPFLPVSAL